MSKKSKDLPKSRLGIAAAISFVAGTLLAFFATGNVILTLMLLGLTFQSLDRLEN